jgi:hypothetical protein
MASCSVDLIKSPDALKNKDPEKTSGILKIFIVGFDLYD